MCGFKLRGKINCLVIGRAVKKQNLDSKLYALKKVTEPWNFSSGKGLGESVLLAFYV